jgi:DNA-directed RNA polymerase alpha subunit
MINIKTIGNDSWEISGLDPSMWNLFRHALMADVAVQAVDRVTFHQYNGPLESSMVAHRLGQLPITGKEPLQFELKVEAPTDAPLTWVTAADITGDGGRVVKGDGPHGSSGFLLVPLLAGQRVHVTCSTSLGTGRQRTTWNSTFPVIKRTEDGKGVLKVETTGALTPKEACVSALLASRAVFIALMK